MSEQDPPIYERREEIVTDEYPNHGSDCPWCGTGLLQGGNAPFCPECPFNGTCFKELRRNPPHKIREFADYKEATLLP